MLRSPSPPGRKFLQQIVNSLSMLGCLVILSNKNVVRMKMEIILVKKDLHIKIKMDGCFQNEKKSRNLLKVINT